jgi:YD repeat-containing protein
VLNPFGQLATTEFDPDGKPVLQLLPNGAKTELTYTPRDWLASIVHRKADNSVLDSFEYFYTDALGTYDPTGHLRREVDAGGRTHAFFYNPLYELTSETHPDFGTLSYQIDANGNRISKSGTGFTEWYGVDGNNKLLWTNQAGNFAPTSEQARGIRTGSRPGAASRP